MKLKNYSVPAYKSSKRLIKTLNQNRKYTPTISFFYFHIYCKILSSVFIFLLVKWILVLKYRNKYPKYFIGLNKKYVKIKSKTKKCYLYVN